MFSFCENAVGLQEFGKLNMLNALKHDALIIRLSAEWNGSSLKKTVPIQPKKEIDHILAKCPSS